MSETNFAGKLYDQKAQDGTKQRVIDQEAVAAVMADSAVQAASTVAELVTALTNAFAALS